MNRFGKLLLSLALVAGALVVSPTAAGAVPSGGVVIGVPASVPEGGSAQVTATRTGDTTGELTVSVTIGAPGTVTGEPDGVVDLSWLAGETDAKSITVDVAQDLLDNDGRTVAVSATTNGPDGISGAPGSISVIDDDAAPGVSVSLPATINEGATEQISITRTGATGAAISATAVVGAPGVVTSANPVSWAAGETGAKTIDVNVPQDTIDNDGRTVAVTVTSTGSAATTGDSGPIAVIDDDAAPPPPGVSVTQPASIPEGGQANLAISRTGSTVGALSATVSIDGLSPGSLPNGGVVSWTAGETGAKPVAIAVADDDLFNEGRAVSFTVTTPGLGGVSGDLDPIPIANDDAKPGVQLVTLPVQVVEGETGTIVLARTGATGQPVSGTVSVASGPATISGPATVSWAPFDADQKSVDIEMTDNGSFDGNRNVTIAIAVSDGGPLSGAEDLTVVAADDESRVRMDESSIVVNETAPFVVIPVRREGTVGAVSVTVEFFDPPGKAAADLGEDYEIPSDLTIDWPAGVSGVKNLTVFLDDPVADVGSEYFGVRFDTVSGALTGTPSQTEVRLRNVTNTAPVGNPDGPGAGTTTAENTPIAIDVLANDLDADSHELTLVTSSGSVTGGSYDCSASRGDCRFTPSGGFLGIATFTYAATDGVDSTGPTTVSVVVGSGDEACSAEPGELGTSGDDDITGDADQDEVLCGLGGADSIAGLGGADLLRGGPGDDTLIIEGADSLEGGSGSDVGVLTLGSGADSVEVRNGELVVNGEVVTFSSIEELQIDLGGGNDTVVVTPSQTAIELVGGGGFDRLTYNSGGLENVVETSDTITATGVQPLGYSTIEIVETDESRLIGTSAADDVVVTRISQDLVIDLLGAGDLLEVALGALDGVLTIDDSGTSGTDELFIIDRDTAGDILVGSGTVRSGDELIEHDGIEVVEVLGQGGDDTITVEALGLAAAASAPSVKVDGGMGTDTLIVNAGGLDASVDVTAGIVNIAGRAPIEFRRIEFVDVRDATTEIPVASTAGYWMIDRIGTIYPFGAAVDLDDAPVSGAAVDLVPTPDGQGVWVLDSNGGVYALGTAGFFGGPAGTALDPGESYVAIAPTPSGQGYWIFTSRGRVFTYGDAVNHGDVLDLPLNGAIVDAIPTVSGRGYWMLGADGGVFALGDAEFFGSTGSLVLNQPAVGLVPDPDGVGYWFVATDGGVFAFEADFLGSMGSTPLNQPVNGMIPYGGGYLLVASDGGVFVYSDLPFVGSLGGNPPPNPVVGIAAPISP